MIGAGIDAGSRAIKVVVFDGRLGRIVAQGRADQGVAQDELACALFHGVLKKARIARKTVARIVATGYGRGAVDIADATVTEITCHARGARRLRPEARTVVDIGGQDSKVIRLDADGGVRDFAMNDRCAAGTGRFLELVAQRLGVGPDALGELAAASSAPEPISSMCAVFAETEIVGLLASNARPADIVAGVQTAIASRIAGMAGRLVCDPVVFTGGVALVAGMDRALAAALSHPVAVCPDPVMAGALGAALLAAEGAAA